MDFIEQCKRYWQQAMEINDMNLPFPEISNRQMKNFGVAAYRRSGEDKGKLILSKYLEYASDKDIQTAICHEACHAMEDNLSTNRDSDYIKEFKATKGHNKLWFDLKSKCERAFGITISPTQNSDLELPKLKMSTRLGKLLELNGYNKTDIIAAEGELDGYIYDDKKQKVVMTPERYTSEDWTMDDFKDLTYELDSIGERYDDETENDFIDEFLKKSKLV